MKNIQRPRGLLFLLADNDVPWSIIKLQRGLYCRLEGKMGVEGGRRDMQEPIKVYNTAVEALLEVIGGKWKPVILFHLTFGKKRNGELMKLMPAIAQKVLTQQLGELMEAGIISRISHHQIPPKVEYELTEYGWSLKEILHSMCRWGDTHVEKVYGNRAKILFKPPTSDG